MPAVTSLRSISSRDINRTADEIGVWLTQLMSLDEIDRKEVTAGIVASVVPATLFSLRNLCRKYFGCQALVVGAPDVDLGLKVIVDRPEEVGADRLVNAVAAHDEYGGPLVIVDFGTATTFDVIDTEGSYLGGAIAPGLNISAEALYEQASKLPRVEICCPPQVIAKNTVNSMQAGLFYGYVGLVDGIVGHWGRVGVV